MSTPQGNKMAIKPSHIGDIRTISENDKPQADGSKSQTDGTFTRPSSVTTSPVPSIAQATPLSVNRAKSIDSLISRESIKSFDRASYEQPDVIDSTSTKPDAASAHLHPSRTVSSTSTGYFIDELFDLTAIPSLMAKETSSLEAILDETLFIRLINSPVQGASHLTNGQFVGCLSVLQLTTGSMAMLQVRYSSHYLGVVATLRTLAQLGLRPAFGSSPVDQTMADMASHCAQPPLVNLCIYSPQLANQLKQQGYPYQIVSFEQVTLLP